MKPIELDQDFICSVQVSADECDLLERAVAAGATMHGLLMAGLKTDRWSAALALLREIAAHHHYDPNSDYYERCGCCGNSPYNDPQHKAGCLAPRVFEMLKDST